MSNDIQTIILLLLLATNLGIFLWMHNTRLKDNASLLANLQIITDLMFLLRGMVKEGNNAKPE